MRVVGEENACPDCESMQVSTEWVDHSFPYGRSGAAVTLTARVPVRTCLDCKEQWLDYVAEDLMQAAIDCFNSGRKKVEI